MSNGRNNTSPDVPPKVSVVIPVYNGAGYLDDTLESLRAQTFAGFEAVMVDDGSTDGSAEVMRRACTADPRFRLVGRMNGGPSAARNTGLTHARGEWILFLDADDRLAPRALERMLAVAGEGVDAVVADVAEGEGPGEEPHGEPRAWTAMRDEMLSRMLYQRPGRNHHPAMINGVWGKLLRADMFRGQDGLRFVEGLYYEDLEIMHRVYDRCRRVALLPEKLYLYRQHPGSFIHTFSGKRIDVLHVTDGIVEHFGSEHPNLLSAALDRRFAANFNILMLIEGLNPEGGVPEKYRERYGATYPAVADRCWRLVKEGRFRALIDPKVRLKNKVGALLSYGGRRLLRFLAMRNS